MTPETTRPAWKLIPAIALGTTLNPLNSSMVAVALVTFHEDFHVGLGTSTWLVSAFYLVGAVAQPLMGRLADLLGPRRVFLLGLTVAGAVSVLAPLSPSFGWLVAARAVQALATSTAFPAGLGLIRAASPLGRVPAQSLATLSIAASVSAALGPTVGGLLLALWGWQAIFLVNLPLTLAGIVLGLLWLPSPPPSDAGAGGLGAIDIPGVLLFALTLTPLLAALLEFGSVQSWAMLAVVPVSAALLAVRELRTGAPFFDLRLLGRRPAIIGVFLQFAAVTFVFYSIFIGLPVWLEQSHGYDARAAGLLVLPLTGLGVVMTPVAARLIGRTSPRPALVIGSVFMVAGSALMLALTGASPAVLILLVALVMGVPNGFNNLGLQAALYEATPPERISWAGGQFQTFRYVGATLASTVLGKVFHERATDGGLHGIAYLLVVVAIGIVIVSAVTPRRAAAAG